MRGRPVRPRLPARLLLAAALLLLALPAQAQEAGRAGLVVQYGEDRVEKQCLAVPAEGASGVDLLDASGLAIVADVSSGMGVSVCQIEGQGCDYPAQHCFCQCMGGGECGYWNYFYREPGAETWTYSPLGAVLRTVLPGSVEAWVWGDGTTPPSASLTFEAICAPPTPKPTSVATATQPVPPGGGASPTPGSVAAASPANTTAPPASPTPRAERETPAPAVSAAAGSSPAPAANTGVRGAGAYLAFAGMLLVLAGIAFVRWLRRG